MDIVHLGEPNRILREKCACRVETELTLAAVSEAPIALRSLPQIKLTHIVSARISELSLSTFLVIRFHINPSASEGILMQTLIAAKREQLAAAKEAMFVYA